MSRRSRSQQRLVAAEPARLGDGEFERIARVLTHIHLPAETADRDIIHSEAIGYSVDGIPVRDARGMFGERLGVDVHLVTATSGAMRNLQVCVRRAHLEIAERVVAAHAAGLSSLVSDERDLGAGLAGALLISAGDAPKAIGPLRIAGKKHHMGGGGLGCRGR